MYPSTHHLIDPIPLPLWSSSIVAVFLSCLVTCGSSQQPLFFVPRFLVRGPANSDCPGSEMRAPLSSHRRTNEGRSHIAIGGFVAQINDLGNASMRRAFMSKLVAFSAVQTSFVVRHFEVTSLRKTTSRCHPRSTGAVAVEG